MVAWPLALYLYLVHGDWTSIYLFDRERLSAGMLVLVLLAELACLLGGWGAGFKLVRRGQLRALYYTLAGGAALMLALAAILHERLGSDTSYVEYHAGRRVPLGD